MKQILAALFFLILTSSSAKGAWFDQSHESLLPRQVDKKLLNYQEFPIFWWNFLVLEFPQGKPVPWGDLRARCTEALHSADQIVRLSACAGLQGTMKDLLSEWSRDFLLRHPKPAPAELKRSMDQTLAKASLPMERSILELIRMDPFNSLEEYQKKVLEKAGLSFENHQGLFYSVKENRVLIPVQMPTISSNTTNIKQLLEQAKTICQGLDCQFLGGVGPHFSTWDNESRIKEDVSVVAKVGWVILFGFCLFFVISKRWRLLFLFPPLLISTGLSTLITYVIFGKIHGLTLSFGPSIVGMAIDYGIHGAFAEKNEKRIWKTNLFGLLTTLAIFFVLLFSELPILNQLAVFSIFGLTLSFLFFYLIKIFFGKYYHVSAFQMGSGKSKLLSGVAMVLMGLGLLSPFFMHPDLSLKQLNYQAPKMEELRNWVYTTGKAVSPLIDISAKENSDVLQEAEIKASWAQSQNINFENSAHYLPGIETQEKNIESWRSLLCTSTKINMESTLFFQPFWFKTDCDKLKPQDLKNPTSLPLYLRDLSANSKWVTLWFPKNANEEKLIREKFPASESFLTVLSLFSDTLSAELHWMIPTALLIAFLLLLIYSASIKNSFFAIVPFFSGLGCFYIISEIGHLSISFITVIGLIMVFGFSIDYGIFMINLLSSKEYKEGHRVRTSITLASSTTIMGFAPLMFAYHPALRHLGESLFLGALGSYFGAVWGIPPLYQLSEKKISWPRILRWSKGFFLIFLLLITFVLRTYHAGVFVKPHINEQIGSQKSPQSGVWIAKEKYGIHQLILRGGPYERGLESGRLTVDLLKQQEDVLIHQLRIWIPSDWALQGLILSAILWFQGADRYFENGMLEEMYGTSQSATPTYNYLADEFTRQVAYHGLHEVGQMVVDQGFEAMGCTVVAVPWKKSWILGRNFDFEGGRIFDSEKIVKWVFPDRGHAFVSIIWAGMVGAVTGVNDQGVYVSLNAAGSSDFKRLGLPSTLVLVKTLQEASSAKQAVDIIKKEQMFITDIFVVLDSHSGELFRIEKSPEKTEVIQLSKPHIVTNHLIGEVWQKDSTNSFRREHLTSLQRQLRGEELLTTLQQKKITSDSEMQLEVLKILRDKGEVDHQPLHIGNRLAIDSLIATHSVIYNALTQNLYVSQGPGLAGKYTGFNLSESFRQGRPVVIGELPRDPVVSDQLFYDVRTSNKEISRAKILIRQKKCDQAEEPLKEAEKLFKEQNFYYEVLGDWYECRGELLLAKAAWEKSLALHTPYLATTLRLRAKVNQ